MKHVLDWAKSHLKHMFPGNLLAVGYPQVSGGILVDDML